MKHLHQYRHVLSGIFAALLLSACAAGGSGLEPVEIEQEELGDYWIAEHDVVHVKGNRRISPDRVARGGMARVRYLVNSDGEVAWTRIVESEPVDAWGRMAEEVVAANRYRPAPGNGERRPVIVTKEVRFEGTGEIDE